MKKTSLLLLLFLAFATSSCSIFSKKEKEENPEKKRVLCQTLKNSFENEKELGLKSLNNLTSESSFKEIKVKWASYSDFYEESLSYLQNEDELISSIKKVLSSKKKSFKQLSKIYGQFYGSLNAMAEDKAVSQAFLSKLIDVDFVKEHSEKLKAYQFDEGGIFSNFFIEVVSDFLNDDIYVRISRPVALKPSNAALPREIQIRLADKKSLQFNYISDIMVSSEDSSLKYFFSSEAHKFKPREANFFDELTYILNDKILHDGRARRHYQELAFERCKKKKRKRF